MAITLFSDPHLGVNKQGGTNPATRVQIRRNILDITNNIEGDNLICLGDLFHTFSNQEGIIEDAYNIYNRLSLCLAGNHDLKATADSVGSLQLLGSLNPEPLVINKFGEAGIDVRVIDGVKIVSIPHCSTQDLFFDSLVQAEAEGGELLLLHANWDAPEHHNLSNTELNFTKEYAEELLKVFRYTIIGHSHNCSTHLNGRVINIGAVYPTSFNDVRSKRYLTYELGEFTSHETWNSSKYAEYTWPSIPENTEAEFIKITGTRTQAEGKEFLAALNQLRKEGNVLAIKDDTILESMQAEFESNKGSPDLTTSIRNALADKPDELALFNELSVEDCK